MRTLTAFLAAAGFLVVGLRTAAAQHEHHEESAPAAQAESPSHQMMMGPGMKKDMKKEMTKEMMPGMHGAMMNSPLHQALSLAFVLPELQSELGLSTQQAQQLREMKQSMLTADTSSAARLEAKQKELDALLSVPEAKTGEVKTRMTELASLKADRQFAVFETATKMKASLTADQRAKLSTLKAEQLHETMMMRVPMGEHKLFMGLVE